MKKFTSGYVVQIFDDAGKCIDQHFIAGDQVEWEDEEGDPCEAPEHEYQPFEMVGFPQVSA